MEEKKCKHTYSRMGQIEICGSTYFYWICEDCEAVKVEVKKQDKEKVVIK